jgi:hypothetical protein
MLGDTVDNVEAQPAASKEVQQKDLILVVVVGLVVVAFVAAILIATYIVQAN